MKNVGQTTKQCIACGQIKRIHDYYAHPEMADGYLNKCKRCCMAHAKERHRHRYEYIRAYDRARSKLPRRRRYMYQRSQLRPLQHPEKARANQAVSNAIRGGRLVRQPCEACGTTERVQAHHDDYSRPLDVRWLCFVHHRQEHGQYQELVHFEVTP